jgi:hypothetical protein
VSNSFQYLVNSWTTIVELLSVYKASACLRGDIGWKTIAEDRPDLSAGHQRLLIELSKNGMKKIIYQED